MVSTAFSGIISQHSLIQSFVRLGYFLFPKFYVWCLVGLPLKPVMSFLFWGEVLIEIKQKENYCSLSDRYTTVALDTNLTDELIEEGYVNEIISKLQTMRKDSGFNVTDHISVSVCGNDKITSYVKENEAKIAKIVLCDKFVYDDNVKHSKAWDINGENVTLGVEVI